MESIPANKGTANCWELLTQSQERSGYFPRKERTAAVTTDCILTGIILRDGCPLVLHSDHAREFLAVTQGVLTKILGIKNTTTLGHHPKGNGQIERV